VDRGPLNRSLTPSDADATPSPAEADVAQRKAPAWWRWVWFAYWAALFALTHVPKLGRLPSPTRHADKIVHFGLFFLLTLLGYFALSGGAAGRRKRTLLVWSALYLAYAAVDEWTQQFVGRTPSLADWLADATGVSLATVVILCSGRKPRSSRNATTTLV